MFPAIFLDRDGVIIENRADYVRDWSQVSIFPNAIKALSNPKLGKYKIVIVTNQSAVGRGIISVKIANNINNRLVDKIHTENGHVDGVYLCPHSPENECACRKPKPGLLLQAAKDLSLNLNQSWMIGDAWSDIQAGQAAGVKGTILVKTGRGEEQLKINTPIDVGDHQVCDNLIKALDLIIVRDNIS